MPWNSAIGRPNWRRSRRVGGGVVGRALGDPDGLRGHAEARVVERAERDVHAAALLADQVVGGDADVVEDRLAGRRALDPELVLELADAEARPVGLDHEGADAARALGRRVGLGEDDVEVGDPEVGDPVLGAVDHPLVAVAHGAGDHPAGVRAGLGLGERERGRPLARRAARQEALLELVGAEQLDRQRAELLDHQHQRARGARARDLLHRHVEHQRAGAGAAVLLVERQAEQVVLGEQPRAGPTGTRPSRRSRPRAGRRARRPSCGSRRGTRPAPRSASRCLRRRSTCGLEGSPSTDVRFGRDGRRRRSDRWASEPHSS